MINKMKKIFIIILVLSLSLVLSCASPDQRKEMASKIGTVVFQLLDNQHGGLDLIIVKNDKGYFLLRVDRFANIQNIEPIDMQCDEQIN